MAEELVEQKVELLAQQKAKCDRIHELLNGHDGFNEHSRKTLKNLEAAITASKRPGYFSYYEAPDHLKEIVRNDEVGRLHSQVMQLQRQIVQLSEKIDSHVGTAANAYTSPGKTAIEASAPTVHSMKQWFATYGSPKQATSEMYTSFTPDKKVYGGTSHYSAFRSQASTMMKGRLTK